MLCWFLLHSKVTQLYIHTYIHINTYIYIYIFISFSIMVYHRILNIVPCTIQQDLIVTSHFIVTTYVAFCCFLSPFPRFAWFNQVTMHYLLSPLLSVKRPWPLMAHEWLSSPFPTFITISAPTPGSFPAQHCSPPHKAHLPSFTLHPGWLTWKDFYFCPLLLFPTPTILC